MTLTPENTPCSELVEKSADETKQSEVTALAKPRTTSGGDDCKAAADLGSETKQGGKWTSERILVNRK